MSRLVVLGDPVWVEGFVLAGATVLPATDAAEVRAAWDGLPEDAAVLVMTPDAAEALGDAAEERPYLLSVVIPR
jgi:vacuolar-type H+-ATPase subunit F/Vma7